MQQILVLAEADGLVSIDEMSEYVYYDKESKMWTGVVEERVFGSGMGALYRVDRC